MEIQGIVTKFGPVSINRTQLAEKIGHEVEKRVTEKTGIHNRFIVSNEDDILELASSAIVSEQLIEKLQSCNFIIVISQHTERRIPPPSTFIFKDYDLRDTLVLDLNRGCSGFCEALVLANSLFISGAFKKGVIIAAENYSKIIRPTNRNLAPLFSDAATFTFLTGHKEDFFYSNFASFSTMYKALAYNKISNELEMNGGQLLSFVKTVVIPRIEQLLNSVPKGEKITQVFVHQGSELVVDTIYRSLERYGLKPRFVCSDVGNLNSSTIPYAIDKVRRENGDIVDELCLLSGFGVGLSFCNILFRLNFTNANN